MDQRAQPPRTSLPSACERSPSAVVRRHQDGPQEIQPLLLALLRFALAGGILWVVWRLRPAREELTRARAGALALVGFVSLTVYSSFENTGIARTSASEAAIAIAN